MNEWKVIKVINGDTIEVSPEWVWGDERGTVVTILGYVVPENNTHFYIAKRRLENLLLYQNISLVNPNNAGNGRLICEVKLSTGINVADYFSDYKVLR